MPNFEWIVVLILIFIAGAIIEERKNAKLRHNELMTRIGVLKMELKD